MKTKSVSRAQSLPTNKRWPFDQKRKPLKNSLPVLYQVSGLYSTSDAIRVRNPGGLELIRKPHFLVGWGHPLPLMLHFPQVLCRPSCTPRGADADGWKRIAVDGVNVWNHCCCWCCNFVVASAYADRHILEYLGMIWTPYYWLGELYCIVH